MWFYEGAIQVTTRKSIGQGGDTTWFLSPEHASFQAASGLFFPNNFSCNERGILTLLYIGRSLESVSLVQMSLQDAREEVTDFNSTCFEIAVSLDNKIYRCRC